MSRTNNVFLHYSLCTRRLVFHLHQNTIGFPQSLVVVPVSGVCNKRAFEAREKLMLKVKELGIDGNVYNWIENWLSNRKQRVGINGNWGKGGKEKGGYLSSGYVPVDRLTEIITRTRVACLAQRNNSTSQNWPRPWTPYWSFVDSLLLGEYETWRLLAWLTHNSVARKIFTHGTQTRGKVNYYMNYHRNYCHQNNNKSFIMLDITRKFLKKINK